MPKRTHLLIIAYDIASDRRRNRVAKCLAGYGWRVNYSVFACEVDAGSLDAIKRKTEALIKRPADSVLYFLLCSACRDRAETKGGLVSAHGHLVL